MERAKASWMYHQITHWNNGVLSWSLERAKANWTYDQITHWNNGVMDHNGNIDFEKLQKIMYTPHIYGCSESNYILINIVHHEIEHLQILV